MKILFCKNTFAGPISGADEIAVSYAIELKKAGNSVSVLLVQAPVPGDSQAARLKDAGVPLSSLASTAFSRSLVLGREVATTLMRTFPPMRRLIRSNSRRLVFHLLQRYHAACCEYLTHHRPDVVHVMTPDPGAVMLIRAAHAVGIPVIYHEVGIPFHPPGFEEVYERFATVLPLCSRVAALSPSLAEEMGRILPHIDQPLVLPLISQEAASVNGGPSAQDEVACFGFAARLEHLKGPLRFVEGLAIARRTQPAVKLKIAGDGSQRSHLIALLQKLNLEREAELTGVYTTPHGRSLFMQSIDVFVSPSLSEGTPNAVIEAMAHGKPVIATDVGGTADIVTEDVGIVVPPDDKEALGAAMARLAGDFELRRAMGIAARSKFEQLFTARAVLPMLIDFYEGAVSQNHLAGNGRAQKSVSGSHPWFQVSSNSKSY